MFVTKVSTLPFVPADNDTGKTGSPLSRILAL